MRSVSVDRPGGATNSVAPSSPSDRTNTMPIPARQPGASRGRVTCRPACQGRACRTRATSRKAGSTRRHWAATTATARGAKRATAASTGMALLSYSASSPGRFQRAMRPTPTRGAGTATGNAASSQSHPPPRPAMPRASIGPSARATGNATSAAAAATPRE